MPHRVRLCAGVLMALCLPALAWADLFGLPSVRTRNIESIPKWMDVMGRTQTENLPSQCSGSGCSGLSARWWEMLAQWRTMSRSEQLRAVNSWHNLQPYIEDIDNWGRSDYWATPRQFHTRSGDCEDYAIAKYLSFQQLGWPEESLRVVVLRDTLRGIAHAVLAVRHQGTNYILDNLSTEPLPDSAIPQYSPYYAVNGTHRWVFLKPQ